MILSANFHSPRREYWARIFHEAHPVRQTRIGDMDRFKCVLIGEGTLLIRCGKILRSLGHEICAVISLDALVTRWAEQGHLPHFRNVQDFASPRVRPFAYLFSIVNSQILTQEILDLALMGAINYHDALLPRNAGSYATSRALLNQEACHGITWHLMNSRVDAGDLLFQWPVDIVPGETAFTLNAKC
jgi:hypothetical protein